LDSKIISVKISKLSKDLKRVKKKTEDDIYIVSLGIQEIARMGLLPFEFRRSMRVRKREIYFICRNKIGIETLHGSSP